MFKKKQERLFIMLKLNASYSKKVPADGSQSYHASIEVELPDGLSSEQQNTHNQPVPNRSIIC